MDKELLEKTTDVIGSKAGDELKEINNRLSRLEDYVYKMSSTNNTESSVIDSSVRDELRSISNLLSYWESGMHEMSSMNRTIKELDMWRLGMEKRVVEIRAILNVTNELTSRIWHWVDQRKGARGIRKLFI